MLGRWAMGVAGILRLGIWVPERRVSNVVYRCLCLCSVVLEEPAMLVEEGRATCRARPTGATLVGVLRYCKLAGDCRYSVLGNSRWPVHRPAYDTTRGGVSEGLGNKV